MGARVALSARGANVCARAPGTTAGLNPGPELAVLRHTAILRIVCAGVERELCWHTRCVAWACERDTFHGRGSRTLNIV